MTWLAWRQFRGQAVLGFGLLAAVAVVLALTGPHLAHLYDTTVRSCHAAADCGQATSSFTRQFRLLQLLGTVLVVVPGLVGAFWGAPLVARELEAGTHRLVWTQTVTRRRWLAVKLLVVGAASAALAGLFSLAVSWWSAPLDAVNANRFGIGMFGERGVVPAGYALFAFALGVTAGVLCRRTLPAMAATVIGFVAARLAVAYWIRPHFASPVHAIRALSLNSVGFGSLNGAPATLVVAPGSFVPPNAWVYSDAIVGRGGQALPAQTVDTLCPTLRLGRHSGGGSAPAPAAVQHALANCVATVGRRYHQFLTYQPPSRYWTFQWDELALFTFASLLLMVGSYWWLRRHSA